MLPIRIDCRFYTGGSPCRFHKRDRRPCDGCGDYDPIERRLLIVKRGAAGDVLRTTCLLPAMKRQHPAAHITWIVEAAAAPVLANHPLIDRVLTSDACLPVLLVERFDVVYGLDTDARSAVFSALAKGASRLGYLCDEAGRVVPGGDSAVPWWLMGLDDRRKTANRKTYQRLMFELCGLSGAIDPPYFDVPEASRDRVRAFRSGSGLNRFGAVLGLNTGGGSRWAQKKWTPAGYQNFIALTRARHPDTAIVLVGGPDEVELNARLTAAGIEGLFDGGCGNSFADFAALIESMDVLVTSDSLGLHTALAVGTPAVAFVGPTSPWELELYGLGDLVHADVDCLGCYLAACDKPVTCMERLEPDAVLEKAEAFLSTPAPVPAWVRAAPAPAGLTGEGRTGESVYRRRGVGE